MFKPNIQRFAIVPDCKVRDHDTIKIFGLEESLYIRNPFGHYRNDISKLLDSNNVLSYQHALDQLSEIRKNQPDTSKLSKEQLYTMVRPRWCQTPNQIMAFEQYLDDQQIAWLESLKQEDDTKTVTDPPALVAPAASAASAAPASASAAVS